ncbi:PQQ-binding-like beta-propeller repeat protein [Brevundimonas sp.]|uniref:outer membrane protein assembly factor BamB family protein n=1 Tax=Brevundimonas sp. TaxID=1871086 RepID=UPI0028999A72|nr:PQQ-binding-like beta-propeller repeat protein [Brevundimonas sp.]
MKKNTIMGAVAGLALLVGAGTAVVAQDNGTTWRSYGQNPGATNFSPLTQINADNVHLLQRAWTFRYGGGTDNEGDRGLDHRWEVTPLVIDGVMYFSTPTNPNIPELKSTITALVPETGEVLWKWESERNIHGRGIAWWPGDETHGPRIIFATDKGYLAALDVRTQQLATDFGQNGLVDAYVGVVSETVGESRRDTYTIPNPVAIYKNLIITGARPGEMGPPGPRGDVRAWDARTGELVWNFHTVPQPGEANHETYVGDEWKDRSGANVWSTITIDEEKGIVFAPVGDLNGRAQGPELYANSLIALDANTGALKWYQQITHKDLWDWDMPTPPVLVDFKQGDETVKGIALPGKQSLLFVFDRETGRPLHEVNELPTPRSDDPNDTAWPTQPFPVRPGPLARVTMTRDEIPNITPEQYAYCTAFWDENNIEVTGLYGRPKLSNGTLSFPSTLGGPNWGGPSYNPNSDVFIVNVQNMGQFRAAGPVMQGFGAPRAPGQPAPRRRVVRDGEAITQSGFQYRVNADIVLPCTPTPWGELVAVDISQGEILWRSPLGSIPGLETDIETGSRNLGGNIQTAGNLVFIGASNDSTFRAFDSRTGKQLWSVELDASAHSTPITYMGRDGKQYVVVTGAGGTAVAARRMSDTLNAFVLP